MNKLINRSLLHKTTTHLTHTTIPPTTTRLLTHTTQYTPAKVLNRQQYKPILQSLNGYKSALTSTTTSRSLARQLATQTRRPTVLDTTYTERSSSGATGASAQQAGWNPVTGESVAPETAGQVLKRNAGLSRHMSKVYQTTFYGLLTWSAAIVAMNGMFAPFMLAHPIITALGGFALSIGGMFGVQSNQPAFRQLPDGSMVSINNQKRIAFAGMTFAGLGITTSPLIMLLLHFNPAAIPISICSALGTMAGAFLYARTRPDGSLTTMGPALTGALVGMIAVSLVNMFVHSPLLSNGVALLTIPLFAAFTAYDTHIAMQDYQQGRPDHLLHSISFFLSFANLFQSFAQLSGIGNDATQSIGSGAAGAASGSGMDALGGAAAGAGMSGMSDSGFGNVADGMDFQSGMSDMGSNVDAPGFFDGIGDTLSSIWEFVSGFFRGD